MYDPGRIDPEDPLIKRFFVMVYNHPSDDK
jgi:hypothetical protein